MKETKIFKSREHLGHLLRVFWLDHEIRAGRYPNAKTIADHFECSEKTAQRTLDFMRDRLRMPLEYSAEHRGWYYTEPVYGLPAVEMTESDLISILLAEKLARQYRGTGRGEMTQRQADPLHLRNSAGEWYLIAWDHLRQAPRDFLVSRIKELNVTEQHFDWPPGFTLEEYLQSGFGMICGNQLYEVEILFDEYQSRWMREGTRLTIEYILKICPRGQYDQGPERR